MFAAKSICNFNRLTGFIPGRKKNILILKNDGLGDFIVWIPYAMQLRRHFPADQYRIMIWTDDSRDEFVKSLPFVDGRIFLNHRNRVQWIVVRLLFWMFHYYDLIINATSEENDLTIPYGRNNFCIFSRPDKKGFYDASSYCRHVIRIENTSIHERYNRILHLLGMGEKIGPVDFRKFATPCLPRNYPSYFVVCPGASDPHRCWEEEKFAQLIERLLNSSSRHGVLVGATPVELEKCRKIRSRLKHPEKITDLSGKTSVAQLLDVVSNADFLVSNETGTAHIGGMVGTLSFILCGGGDFGSFVPYPPGIEGKSVYSVFSGKRKCFKCFWKNPVCRMTETYPCISDIAVNDVFAIISSKIHGQRDGRMVNNPRNKDLKP